MTRLTPEERATLLYEEITTTDPMAQVEYNVILLHIKQAMRDQRHACAEALAGVEGVPQEAHSVVFNAQVYSQQQKDGYKRAKERFEQQLKRVEKKVKP